MTPTRTEIRLALPSKGRLAQGAVDLLASVGMRVHKPNPRQYRATIPSLPGLTVFFQRGGDIVVSVRDGSVDFGITGHDVVSEQCGDNGEILPLLKQLGFGGCSLNVIVPESWGTVRRMADLKERQAQLERPLRVVTKFPNLTRTFFEQHGLTQVRLISAEGTLEIAPTIGYADVIIDLVSSGTTLRDNRLRTLDDGLILESKACLIANRTALKTRPEVLAMARQLLEFIIAHLRATDNLTVFANMRGESPEAIAGRMATKSVIGGLQGPTISRIVQPGPEGWYAAHIVVRKDQLAQAIAELRDIGGSGVIVAPLTHIFEEEPEACRAMLAALETESHYAYSGAQPAPESDKLEEKHAKDL